MQALSVLHCTDMVAIRVYFHYVVLVLLQILTTLLPSDSCLEPPYPVTECCILNTRNCDTATL